LRKDTNKGGEVEQGDILNSSRSRMTKISRVRTDLAGEVIDSIFYKQELARVDKNLQEEEFIDRDKE